MLRLRIHTTSYAHAIALLLLPVFCGCSEEASIPIQFERGIQQAISKSRSAVVTIEVASSDSSYSAGNIVSRGTGVVISKDGTIATTCEYISQGNHYVAMFQDGCASVATLVGSDRETNIAILTTGNHQCGCYPIDVVSTDKISAGTIGIFVNNSSVSKGISAGMGIMAESWLGGDDYWSTPLYIAQTGDILTMEGAPVVSIDGRLIGICDAIVESHHGSWTVIPTATILKIADELKKNGGIKRSWIGVSCSYEESEQNTASGVKPHIRINQVVAGSPAEKAGIKVGDFIAKLDQKPIGALDPLRQNITSLSNGSKLNLEIVRSSGNVEAVDLTTVQLPDDPTRQRLCTTRSL